MMRIELGYRRQVGIRGRPNHHRRGACPAHPEREARIAPDRLRSRRCFSRVQSRSFSVSRLSYCFLPRARPISSLMRPLLKWRFERRQRIARALDFADQAVDLQPMHQQLARAASDRA